jgi:hypothetical protein
MGGSLLYETDAWIICSFLLVGMLGMFYIGLFFRRRFQKNMEGGLGAIESALFGLLALILAFTFGQADSRYNQRRGVVIEESNDIGTAILRADMYVDSERVAFRKDFLNYVNSRISFYESGRNMAVINKLNDSSNFYASHLWNRATRLSKDPANLAASNQMIPALNTMIDITTTRNAALEATIPESILLLLFSLSMICCFFIGYSVDDKKKLNRLAFAGFIILITMVIFVILDLDRPRRGFINLDRSQQHIKDLLQMLK